MKKLKLSTQILIGLAAGIILGLLLQGAPDFAQKWIGPIGTFFLGFIRMIIVPLVLSSLVVGTCGLGDAKKLGRIGGKTILYYLCTTAFAVTIGVILANLSHVGAGINIPTDAKVTAAEIPSAANTILGLIPTNPAKSIVDGNMLQIIVFAIILGGGIMLLKSKSEPLFHFFDSLAEVCYKIIGVIMKFAPIGVFALITPVVAANGPKVLLPLLKVIIVVYIACILHATVVYSSVLKIFANFSPIKFFKGLFPAMALAFTTSSSSGTLPVTMKCAEENLGVPKTISSFVLPLGATINMDGTAIYQGICALFVAQVYGIDLSFAQQVTIILMATLASIGTAGVPSAGLIMLTMVLQSVGLPLEGVALVAGIDRILDMIRTTVNITGDAVCSVIVAASEKSLNRDILKQSKPTIAG